VRVDASTAVAAAALKRAAESRGKRKIAEVEAARSKDAAAALPNSSAANSAVARHPALMPGPAFVPSVPENTGPRGNAIAAKAPRRPAAEDRAHDNGGSATSRRARTGVDADVIDLS
jgi:hypothetical protein